MFGNSVIELISAADRSAGKNISKTGTGVIPGFIHLCYDIAGMDY